MCLLSHLGFVKQHLSGDFHTFNQEILKETYIFMQCLLQNYAAKLQDSRNCYGIYLLGRSKMITIINVSIKRLVGGNLKTQPHT